MSPRNSPSTPNHARGRSAAAGRELSSRQPSPKVRTRASRSASPHALPGSNGKSDDEADAVPSIGDNLRKLRTERNLSLDALAQLSGVSRAMLGQIELKRSVPTITVLWRIAKAFDVPFSSLMREPEHAGPAVLRQKSARFLTSADGTFKSRALFPPDRLRFVEFYEIRLAAGAIEDASAHPAGTLENIVVSKGTLEVSAGSTSSALGTGDAMVFRADVPHRYHNPGSGEAVVYMVITYAHSN